MWYNLILVYVTLVCFLRVPVWLSYSHCLHISPLITGISLHAVASVRKPLAVPCTLIWPLSLRKYCRILKVNYLYFRQYSHLSYRREYRMWVSQPDDTHISLHWAASIKTPVTRAYLESTDEFHVKEERRYNQLVLMPFSALADHKSSLSRQEEIAYHGMWKW